MEMADLSNPSSGESVEEAEARCKEFTFSLLFPSMPDKSILIEDAVPSAESVLPGEGSRLVDSDLTTEEIKGLITLAKHRACVGMATRNDAVDKDKLKTGARRRKHT